MDLNEEIRRTIEHSSCTVFLKPLAELIFSLGFKEDWNATYYIAESEDQFFKPHRKKRFVALNLHSGYLSCNAKTLCDILHEDYPEQCRDITKNKMIKELRRHQLIRCDSDGRVPFRWPGDEHKWIHIHVRQLFELTMPGDYLTYFEDAIQRFSTEEY